MFGSNIGTVIIFPPFHNMLDIVTFIAKMWNIGSTHTVTSSRPMKSIAGCANWNVIFQGKSKSTPTPTQSKIISEYLSHVAYKVTMSEHHSFRYPSSSWAVGHHSYITSVDRDTAETRWGWGHASSHDNSYLADRSPLSCSKLSSEVMVGSVWGPGTISFISVPAIDSLT